ncbi:Zinc finger CCCH domain-containing protein [Arachis hypogaea]|nr:Zinc finger CCCH domain-containing protein [Arachis hypogaea]
MDEASLMRNTDCVYFLASPLTCKKGAECEYRHNEIARLNPRDCWYWLSGSCLNPTCAFRHPPLDGQTGVSSEPTQSAVPANKTMVPCDRCSFLHGHDESHFTVKPNKVLSGTAPSTTETHSNPSLTAPKALPTFKPPPKEDLQLSLPKMLNSKVISLHMLNSKSPYPEERFVDNISQRCSEQGSEEQVNGHIEPDERWESSSLDLMFLFMMNRQTWELNEQYLGYEFENPVEYDNMCRKADILYEQEMYDDYRRLDRDLTRANGRRVCDCSSDIILDSMLTRKRIQMSDIASCDGNSGPPDASFIRRHESSSLMVRNRERHQRHYNEQRLRGRLSSQVGITTIDPLERLKLFQLLTSQGYLGIPSSIGQGSIIEKSHLNARPKSLAEIREEKKKAAGSFHCKSTSPDFQDPKPLSEILKGKRSVDGVGDVNVCSN